MVATKVYAGMIDVFPRPQIARDYMYKHHLETLVVPNPAPGSESPNQAVRIAAGLEKVVEGLSCWKTAAPGVVMVPLPCTPSAGCWPNLVCWTTGNDGFAHISRS